MQVQVSEHARTAWSSLPTTAQGRLDLAFEATWLVGLVLVAFLYNGNNYLFFFTQPKQYMVHLIGITFSVLWLFELALNWRPGVVKSSQPSIALWRRPIAWAGRDPSRWLLIFVGLFGIGQVLSALFSQSTSTSILGRNPNDPGYEAYSTVAYLIALTSIVLKMRTLDQVIRFLRVVVLIATATALYGVLQFYGWDPFGFGDVLAFNGTRIFSTYGNPIFFGSVMVMTIPLTMTWALLEAKKGRYWIFAIAAVSVGLQASGVWFTESRGPVISIFFVAVPVIFVACFFLCSRKSLYKLAVINALAALAALLLIIGVTNLLPRPVEDTSDIGTPSGGERVVESISEVTQTGDFVSFSNGRTGIWQTAFELLLSRESIPAEEGGFIKTVRHVFGYGQERFYLVYPLAAQPRSDFTSASHAHNFVLQIWLELGLWGLISFTGIAISTLWIVVKLSVRSWNTRTGTPEKLWLGILTTGLLATLLARSVEQIPGVGRISDLLLFWMLLGFTAAVYRIAAYEASSEKSHTHRVGRAAKSGNASGSGQTPRVGSKRNRRKRSLGGYGGGYDPKPILMVIAIFAAISGVIAFIVVDVNPIRGSVSAIKAINKLRCPANEDRSQYVSYLRSAIEVSPKSEAYTTRYVRQTLDITDLLISRWSQTSDEQQRLNLEASVNEQFDMVEQALDDYLSEVPYSHDSLTGKLRFFRGKLDWLNTLVLSKEGEQQREINQNIEALREEYGAFLDEVTEYLMPFIPVVVSLLTHYANLGMNDKAVELSEYLLETSVSSTFDKSFAYSVVGSDALLSGQYSTAIENFELALVDPGVIVSGQATAVYFSLGEAYRSAGRLPEAIHAYNRAVYLRDGVTVRRGELPPEIVDLALSEEYLLRELTLTLSLEQLANTGQEITDSRYAMLVDAGESLTNADSDVARREALTNLELQVNLSIEELSAGSDSTLLQLSALNDDLQIVKRTLDNLTRVPDELRQRAAERSVAVGNSSTPDAETEVANLVDCEFSG